MCAVQPTTKKKGTIAAIVICSTIGFLFGRVDFSDPEAGSLHLVLRQWRDVAFDGEFPLGEQRPRDAIQHERDDLQGNGVAV